MSRWRAFAIHFGISLVIIGTVAVGLFYLWYPPHLYGFARADRLFGLITGIDIVAGPVLTLLVYKAGKKSLRFDLSVIAVIQAAFLCVAVAVAWWSRPVYLVAAFDRFELVFATQILEEELEAASDTDYATLPWGRPKIVGLRRPTDADELMESVEAAQAGRDLSVRPRYYVPFDAVAEALVDRAKPKDSLVDLAPLASPDLIEVGKQTDDAPADALFLPVTSIRGDALMELDPASAEPVRAVWVSKPLWETAGPEGRDGVVD